MRCFVVQPTKEVIPILVILYWHSSPVPNKYVNIRDCCWNSTLLLQHIPAGLLSVSSCLLHSVREHCGSILTGYKVAFEKLFSQFFCCGISFQLPPDLQRSLQILNRLRAQIKTTSIRQNFL